MNIDEKIKKTLSFFEEVTRADDSKVTVLTSEAPEELQESIHNAHQDTLPRDFVYNTYEQILSSLEGFAPIKDIEDIMPEVVDGLVDIYTHNLTQWLAQDINNVGYLTEAIENGAKDGFQALSMAQYTAIDEVAQCVINYLTQNHD